MAATVEQLARQIKTLTGDEQAQLRAMPGADALLETPLDTERTTLEHLLARGIIARIPDRYRKGYRPDPQAENFTPVPVTGRPVSETLLEDRERQFAQQLLAQGMLDHIPQGYPEGYVDPPAITIDGEPLSETIIRERR